MEPAEIEAYWNDVARRVLTTAGNTWSIKDNWWKRTNLIRMLLDYDFEKKSVLEIGCGAGVTAGLLSLIWGKMFDYVGYDISKNFCDMAKKFFQLNTKYQTGIDIPEPSSSFDYLFLFDVMEHIPPNDKGLMYQDFNRLLKPSAKIFINNPLSESCHNPLVEFGFDMLDIDELCSECRMQVERLTTHSTKHGNTYQFIVLGR